MCVIVEGAPHHLHFYQMAGRVILDMPFSRNLTSLYLSLFTKSLFLFLSSLPFAAAVDVKRRPGGGRGEASRLIRPLQNNTSVTTGVPRLQVTD